MYGGVAAQFTARGIRCGAGPDRGLPRSKKDAVSGVFWFASGGVDGTFCQLPDDRTAASAYARTPDKLRSKEVSNSASLAFVLVAYPATG